MKAIGRHDPYATPALGQESARTAKPHESGASGKATLSKSQILSLDQLPMITRSNGTKSWNMFHGVLATGEAIKLHESMQPAGIAPSPPHRIQHSELILIQEGILSFEHGGKSEQVGSGGVILVAFGTMHAVRNTGDVSAKYLVVSIGGDTGMPAETEKASDTTSNTKEENVLSQSQTFSHDELPVTKLPNGGTMRRVVCGTLVTSEYVEVHEAMLPPGQTAHPLHRQCNSQVLFVREGKLEFVSDDKSELVGPGNVLFVASNALHGLKNVGNIPANYFVVSIGRRTTSS